MTQILPEDVKTNVRQVPETPRDSSININAPHYRHFLPLPSPSVYSHRANRRDVTVIEREVYKTVVITQKLQYQLEKRSVLCFL